MQLSKNPYTHILKLLAKSSKKLKLSNLLFDQERSKRLEFKLGGLNIDLSGQLIDDDILQNLIALANAAEVKKKISELDKGNPINFSEKCKVSHLDLRKKARFEQKSWKKINTFVKDIRQSKKFKNIVNIGIGGSYLGPLTAYTALKPFCDGPTVHFVSNVDPTSISDVLSLCEQETTLFIINSKSFTTGETLHNAELAKSWLKKKNILIKNSFVSVTSSKVKALAWGIDEENVFDFDVGVGGRYSVWSPVGLPVMLGIGMQNFKSFLAGARVVDEHFLNTAIKENVPLLMGLIRVWNRNFLEHSSHGIIPYDQRLSFFPSFIQQLEMESNGKKVDVNGENLTMPASPVIWGEVGNNAQHSFFQFLHQGKETVPIDVLIALSPSGVSLDGDWEESHKRLVINAIAQVEALAHGSLNSCEPHKDFQGNRPATIISWDATDPFTVGSLIALYESITISSGFLWGINSFDQWGVELGKKLERQLLKRENLEQFSPRVAKFLNSK